MSELQIKSGKVLDDIISSLDSLLKARSSIGSGNAFSDNDPDAGAEGKYGLMASMQGLRTVFNVLALDDLNNPVIWKKVVSPHWNSLLAEWDAVLKGINLNGSSDKGFGFNAAPYDKDNALEKLLKEGGQTSEYMDSVSWGLSAAVLANYVFSSGKIPAGTKVPEEIKDLTREFMAVTLALIIEGQAADRGWSWKKGAQVGDLYYTWAVMGCLADLLDYVMGDSEEELGIKMDEKTYGVLSGHIRLKNIGVDLVEHIQKLRTDIAEFTANKYETWRETASFTIKENGVMADGDAEWVSLLVGRQPHPLITTYYELYLLETLILAGYDMSGRTIVPSKREHIKILCDAIKNKYDKLAKSDFAGDSIKSTLTFVIKAPKTRSRGFQVMDAGLWPQHLRSLILYRFYTDQVKDFDSNIYKAYDIMMQDIRIEQGNEFAGVWDSTQFNLAITARCIESLVDLYDYCVLIERGPVDLKKGSDIVQSKKDLAELIAEAVLPYVETRLSAFQKGEEITPTVKENVVDKGLLALYFNALYDTMRGNDKTLMTADEIGRIILGDDSANKIKYEDDSGNYELLGAFALVVVEIISRAAPYIVREILVNGADKKPTISFLEQNAGDIQGRLKAGLLAWCDSEVRNLKASKPMDYVHIFKDTNKTK